MEFDAVIKTRRSVRQFTPQPIPQADIDRILEDGPPERIFRHPAQERTVRFLESVLEQEG